MRNPVCLLYENDEVLICFGDDKNTVIRCTPQELRDMTEKFQEMVEFLEGK